jgi:hypothetical protein
LSGRRSAYAAVLRALAVAHRRYGPVLRKARTVLAAALLIVVAGSVVGIGEIVASSTYDYYLQSMQLERTDSTHLRGGRLDSAAARRQGPLSVAAGTPSTAAAAVEDQHDNDHNYDGNQHGN